MVLLVFAGPIWIYFDARIKWRKDRSGLPAWVWLIAFFGGGFWIPPIYWIVRKPRSVSRFIAAILIFWIFPFSIPVGSFYSRARISKERYTKTQELEVGMTDDEVMSLLEYINHVDTIFDEILGKNIEKWQYIIGLREGWYNLTFEDDTLKKIKFIQPTPRKLKNEMDTQKMKNEYNDLPDLDPAVLRVDELKDCEELRPAETYCIGPDYWLLCCKFLDRESIIQVKGEDLEIGPNFAVCVFGDGQPSFIEFLEGQERWLIKENFTIPDDCIKGRVFFRRPLDGWYEYPSVECDDQKRNVCICLSNTNIVKKIKVAENVIFGLDKENQLHRIWLLNIEYRKE